MRTYARTQLSPTQTANSGVLLQVLPQYQSPSTVASAAATFVVVHRCRPVGLWVRTFVGSCLKYFVLETYFHVWTICCIMRTLVHTHAPCIFRLCLCILEVSSCKQTFHLVSHSLVMSVMQLWKEVAVQNGWASQHRNRCVFSSCRCVGSWILALRMAWILSYISTAMT